jgi:SAM-dependent methyltransferase
VSAAELTEHASYLGDHQRQDAYARALTSHLHGTRRSVLDLGSGSGLLGLLAARAGAERVYAVDSGPVIGPAAEVAKRSPFADRIVHIRGRSAEIELPELVDLAVCDQIGGFAYDAGVLEDFADVRQRLLARDGVLVPSGFRLFVAPAECAAVREQIERWQSCPAGFDFGFFGELAVNTEHRVEAHDVRVLGSAVEVGHIASDYVEPIKGGGTSTVAIDGRCDGLVGYFEAEMAPGITMTNDPSNPERIHRWCNLYPISTRVNIRRGQAAHIDIDVRPTLPGVTWRVIVQDHGDAAVVNERHSTLLGVFIDGSELRRSARTPIVPTAIGEAVAAALALADGSRSTEGVVAAVQGKLRSASAERALRTLLERLTTPAGDRTGSASSQPRFEVPAAVRRS